MTQAMSPNRKRQGGYLLLWWAALLLASALTAWAINPPAGTQFSSDTTQKSLEAAKAALLGYAAAFPDTHQAGAILRNAYVPGHLPCPNLENANPGQESLNCLAQGLSSLGRLPWTSLGLQPLVDGDGECLWYAVSGNYKNNPKANLLNADTPGQFQIQTQGPNGWTTLADDVVAVLMAPGAAKSGQSRPFSANNRCNSALVASNYLDTYPGGSNAVLSTSPEGITTLVQAPMKLSADNDQQPNDRLIWITRKELFDAVNRRSELKTGSAFFDASFSTPPTNKTPALTQRIASCLRDFALANTYKRLPWAAPIKLTSAAPNTFKNDAFNDKKNLLAGRIPMMLWDSKQAIGLPMLGTFATCNSSTNADCRLFRTNNCTDFLPIAGFPTALDGTSNKDSPDGWLDKWKDHLFYAVAADFQPAATGSGNCGTASNCLQVNGRPYAAIVLYAGASTNNQKRLQTAEKLVVENYLEGVNATSITTAGRVFANAGNDQMVCLRPDLSISHGCLD